MGIIEPVTRIPTNSQHSSRSKNPDRTKNLLLKHALQDIKPNTTDSLDWQLVEVSLAFVAPHTYPVYRDEVSPRPPLSTAAGLGTQQGEVTSVVDLKASTLF